MSPVSGGTIACTIYATSASVNTSLGSLDPGSNTVPVTIYLGPFDFTATQITLRADFRIIGSGIGHTTITSVGTNAQNLIVFPQSNNYGVSGVLLQDIRFYGSSGNTSQEGLSSDVSTLTTSQLSYSRFVGLMFSAFKGPSIHLKGTRETQAPQFSLISFSPWSRTLWARWAGPENGRLQCANHLTQIELLIGATQFHICFQIIVVADVSDGQDDIYLGPNNVKGPNQGTYVPLTVFFHNTTFQGGTNGFHIGGAQNLIIDGGHSEQSPRRS